MGLLAVTGRSAGKPFFLLLLFKMRRDEETKTRQAGKGSLHSRNGRPRNAHYYRKGKGVSRKDCQGMEAGTEEEPETDTSS